MKTSVHQPTIDNTATPPIGSDERSQSINRIAMTGTNKLNNLTDRIDCIIEEIEQIKKSDETFACNKELLHNAVLALKVSVLSIKTAIN